MLLEAVVSTSQLSHKPSHTAPISDHSLLFKAPNFLLKALNFLSMPLSSHSLLLKAFNSPSLSFERILYSLPQEPLVLIQIQLKPQFFFLRKSEIARLYNIK